VGITPLALTSAEVRLSLLGGFALARDGRALDLPVTSQRVVALLALHERPLQRAHVSGMLWPNSSEDHAAASLRSALWRMHRLAIDIVETTVDRMWLAARVRVDLREVVARAKRLIDEAGSLEETDMRAITAAGDLLPDLDEDWLLVERERFRQLRVHALEALCNRLTAACRFAEAVDAGLAAVEFEPCRESAHRALIRAHLAEGNPSEAARQYGKYVRLAADELGIEPSPPMKALVAGMRLVHVE
jgi:DNA-binding SARP family transcriptional activator